MVEVSPAVLVEVQEAYQRDGRLAAAAVLQRTYGFLDFSAALAMADRVLSMTRPTGRLIGKEDK